MTRTSRKARAFRPSLSDDMESRVVPSTLTAFQAREQAVTNLIHQRQQFRQNQLVQSPVNLANSFGNNSRFGLGATPTRANFGLNTSQLGFGATPTRANFGNLSLNTSQFGFGALPTRASFGNLNSLDMSRLGFGNNYLNTTGLGYGVTPTMSAFGNGFSTPTFTTNFGNTNSGVFGYPTFANAVGNGGTSFSGPFTDTNPTVVNSLFATPAFSGQGLGASYANSGAYNYGSLYGSYINSGAFSFPGTAAGFTRVFI